MPTSLACFDEALVHGIPETEQTFDTPDLFTHHPIEDGFQMHLKGEFFSRRFKNLVCSPPLNRLHRQQCSFSTRSTSLIVD